MPSSAHFESRLATVAAILGILLEIISPFGSTYTGEYNVLALSSEECSVYSAFVFQETVEVLLSGFYGADITYSRCFLFANSTLS